MVELEQKLPLFQKTRKFFKYHGFFPNAALTVRRAVIRFRSLVAGKQNN